MISPEQRDALEELVYQVLYDDGAVFDRYSVVPKVLDAVLEHVDAMTTRHVFTGVADDFDPTELKHSQAMWVIPEHDDEKALLDAAADVERLDRIASTPKKDVTDDEFVEFAQSGLFGLQLTRADFAAYLRKRATRV